MTDHEEAGVDAPLPSQSTDPAPKRREREVDGLLRAAANLAPRVIGGDIGQEVGMICWIYYSTPEAERFRMLAQSIVSVGDDGDDVA